MRTSGYLGFGLFLVLGLGCAITDYGLITDNDQTANGQGTGIVNTNGQAHIREGLTVVTIWSDGTDESIYFVDQKANGDRTLTTYNNYSTADPVFHDDLYCSPDRSGCAINVSPDPLIGDTDVFDYDYRIHCRGARSLCMLISSTRYYGECGRARLALQDRIRFLNMGRLGTSLGLSGLFYELDATNTTIRLSNLSGFETTAPVTASATLFLSYEKGGRASLDLTHPGFRAIGNAYADFLEAHGTDRTRITVVYNGVSFSKDVAGPVPSRLLTAPSRVREVMNARF